MLVRPLSIFTSDIHTLALLTKSQTPPLRYVCPKYMATALYRFLDSSGSGNGSSLQIPQNIGSNLECLMQIRSGL